MYAGTLIATICLAALGLPTIGCGLWLRRKGEYHRESYQVARYAVGGILSALALVAFVVTLQLLSEEQTKNGVAGYVKSVGYTVESKPRTVIDGYSWTINVRPTTQNDCVDKLYVDYKMVSDHYDYTITEDTFPESTAAQLCKKKLNG